MISKYNKDGSLKEYKIKYVSEGTATNGSKFISFNIADAKKQQDGSFNYINYKVYVYNPNFTLHDGDKMSFQEIEAIEIEEKNNNEKTFLAKTIFAKINPIPATPNRVEVVDNGNIFDNDNIDLPF